MGPLVQGGPVVRAIRVAEWPPAILPAVVVLQFVFVWQATRAVPSTASTHGRSIC